MVLSFFGGREWATRKENDLSLPQRISTTPTLSIPLYSITSLQYNKISKALVQEEAVVWSEFRTGR